MMNKKYTVEEMREAAKAVDDVSVNDYGEYFYEKNVKFNPDLVRDILRQAVDMYERAEEQRKLLASIVHENDSELTGITHVQLAKTELSIVDYILCGKEEK